MKSKHVKIGIALTILLLVVHLVIIDDYGVTWDFHHHFFAGLWHLGIPVKEELTKNIPFTIPDPRGTYDLPFGPLMVIGPAATNQLFFEKFKILPFDNAYHLSIIVSGVIGIFVLYLFLLESFGFLTALAGFTFLALLPRYFGDLHNNMKDVPQAAAFALAIYAFWRLVKYKRVKDLVLACLSFAIAFNTKVNTLFVPVITGAWIIDKKKIFFLLYFLLAPAAALLLWLPLWPNPIERLTYMFRFFLDNTQNLEVLYFGNIYKSGVNVPWHYPFGYLAVTTPVPVLVFFLIGLIRLIRQIRQKPVASLLLFWFFIPLIRYLNPKIGVIDGIRHFEEVVFPLAAIAAVGTANAFRFFNNLTMKQFNNVKKPFLAIITLGIFGYLILQITSYHPYQISYFNELVGGIRGAWHKFDVEYWGTSQKQAIRWLNANAPKDSYVHIVMAADAAAKYLRPDLTAHVNQKGFDEASYVVLLNRESFFTRYWGITEYMKNRQPIYTVSIQGVPLTFIYDSGLKQLASPNQPQSISGKQKNHGIRRQRKPLL